jgi:diaminopimelate decarboxylase
VPKQTRRRIRSRRAASGFPYRDGELHCEGVSLRRIAEAAGTPCYVYSATAVIERYAEFDRALGAYPHRICYSLKANANLHLLRLLARKGAGFDIVSGGELFRALAAGARADRIVFSGVGKTAEELEYALRAGVLLFNCESEAELRLLGEIAVRMKKPARAGLRVNPQVNARTHPYIATGLREHKFGIPMREAEKLYLRAQSWPGIRLEGLSCHIGSQITSLDPFEQAIRRVVQLAERLREKGCVVRHLDAGGGVAVPYRRGDSFPTIAAYANRVIACLRGRGLQLLIEPGRALVAQAGVLLTRVVYTKNMNRKRFIIVDAAMNDLIRPSLYGAHHEIQAVLRSRRKSALADVVGPICETGDFFARSRSLPEVEPGNLLAILTAGAYGFVLSSNYNARPRPAEVVVEGNRFRVARRRESYRDLLRGES